MTDLTNERCIGDGQNCSAPPQITDDCVKNYTEKAEGHEFADRQQGDLTGKGEKLRSSQAESAQAIESAVA